MISVYLYGNSCIYDFKGNVYRYVDGTVAIPSVQPLRSCSRCGKPPTLEGYDACLGYMPGAVAACCGHGIEDPWVTWKNGRSCLRRTGAVSTGYLFSLDQS